MHLTTFLENNTLIERGNNCANSDETDCPPSIFGDGPDCNEGRRPTHHAVSEVIPSPAADLGTVTLDVKLACVGVGEGREKVFTSVKEEEKQEMSVASSHIGASYNGRTLLALLAWPTLLKASVGATASTKECSSTCCPIRKNYFSSFLPSSQTKESRFSFFGIPEIRPWKRRRGEQRGLCTKWTAVLHVSLAGKGRVDE
jgi:hypothetical protein